MLLLCLTFQVGDCWRTRALSFCRNNQVLRERPTCQGSRAIIPNPNLSFQLSTHKLILLILFILFFNFTTYFHALVAQLAFHHLPTATFITRFILTASFSRRWRVMTMHDASLESRSSSLPLTRNRSSFCFPHHLIPEARRIALPTLLILATTVIKTTDERKTKNKPSLCPVMPLTRRS